MLGTFPHTVSTIPSTRSGVPHPYSRLPLAPLNIPFQPLPTALLQHISCSARLAQDGTRAIPAALLKAITTLTATVGSLQDQIRAQSQQITKLRAICKETADLLGDKDQGAPQTKPGPLTGPVTPPTHTGGETHTPGMVRPGLKAPFRPSRGTGFDSEEDKEPRHPKKEPQGTPRRHLGQGKPPTTIQALTGKFKEAFADPDAKRAAARKIAALSQTTTTSKYVTEFCNLMAELDWNKEAYIAQFTQGLHWKVKELLSTKDSVPNKLKAIFAASIKIDNICCENEENRPKKAPTKSPVTATTSTTTTQRVCLLEDPNYVTLEERDCRRASGLCVKCGQKGHGIKQCPNGWKATTKEAAKVGEVVELEKE
ncbi:Retrotransposon gag protein [Rhizoctonia solani]|uniref:Retrotransposon gag protein n=1 Tax=Rhizoctonia solani TaxID=456999 RepID=A0A8H7IB88_9AGAM|nr:Retrotransposon gag protein [Rhizoctonia solani]